MKTLAERIIKARERKGLHQYQLAEKVGIRQQSMQAIESGKTKKPRNIEKIAYELGVPPAWLLFGGVTPWEKESEPLPAQLNGFSAWFTPDILLLDVKTEAMSDRSLYKESIDPGDGILINTKKSPESGDIIVFTIKNSTEQILRKYVEEAGHKHLIAYNKQFKELKFDDIDKIIGVVVKVMHNPTKAYFGNNFQNSNFS